MAGVAASVIPFVPAAAKAVPIKSDPATDGAVAVRRADPIFAAIEAHKAANALYSRVCSISCNMNSSDPGYAKADAATREAGHAEHDAAVNLTHVAPTTMAGLAALLEYVLEDDRDYPGHADWPTEMTDPDVLDFGGEPAEMPFHFWLLRNVRAALEQIGGAPAAA